MVMPSAQQAATNWATGMSQAGTKMTAGINAVTEAPTAKAAARADAYLAGVQRAVANNKWQSGLLAVSLQSWKSAMIDKGVGRASSGAQQAKPKVVAFMTQFLPYLQQGVQALAATPRGDLQTNIQRAVTMMQHNANFKMQRS